MVATKQLRLAMETDEERKAKNGLDMIWIEIGVLISRNELARPVMGTIFLVVISFVSVCAKNIWEFTPLQHFCMASD